MNYENKVEEISRIARTTRVSNENLATQKTLEKSRHVSSQDLNLQSMANLEQNQDIMRASSVAFSLAQRRQTQD